MEGLSNIGTIKEILGRHGFTFSKGLGQNFLINPSVCPRMAEECGAKKGVGVLEVGPGIGVLTNELCKLADKVVSVELDKRLIPVLGETLAEYDNFTLINADIMELDLKAVIEEHFKGLDVVVCANLPYYITSPVVMKLLEEKLPIKSITVMVQKEAAERLTAPVGSRESGAVTVAVNYYSTAETLFNVSRGSFMPSPNVDSAVIKLVIKDRPDFELANERDFRRVVKAGFSQRRKTLSNSLASSLGIDKPTVNKLIEKAGLPPTVRAEKLTLEDFGRLANCLTEYENEQ
ncbi:MAG: 16S rRNA (adenine(1518)-N(6)/adenine(1519)-N(6))-dimethyltransferase RsmA [Ruminococcus sp.]|nr:16S rRNA (adenine(1518)-N(6)/adenine(1519)-N(6))-dimethyltransferase RsmA [Ruminococcus sp.]